MLAAPALADEPNWPWTLDPVTHECRLLPSSSKLGLTRAECEYNRSHWLVEQDLSHQKSVATPDSADDLAIKLGMSLAYACVAVKMSEPECEAMWTKARAPSRD